MREFTNRGIRLEYEVKGEGVPFVFLHGMGGSVSQIYSVCEEHDGIRLITMNQQGHGRSGADWEHYDFDHLGDDAAALLDELEIKKAYFGGISMGAAVSLNVAVRHPGRVEGLLLVRNAWTDRPMAEEVQNAYRDLGGALEKKSIEAFYRTRGWELVKAPSAYTRNAFTSTFEDEACLRYWKKYLILPGNTAVSSRADIEALNIPVTILANKNDLCHPFSYGEYMHECIPNSRFTQLPDKDKDSAGHKKMINQEIDRLIKGYECT